MRRFSLFVVGAAALACWTTARGENNASPDHGAADPPIAVLFGGERLDLWSFQPIRRHDPPLAAAEVFRPGHEHPIDAFIGARVREAGLAPSPEADRRTLARRLSFGLRGLPPSAEEVEAFSDDPSGDAFDRFVDRLLASREYSEHMARLWMDVARYSDSNGFDWDEFRPFAWRYRDYLVRSFARDVPFDRFIVEQLAGDETFRGPPATADQRDALVATGFLRLGPHDNSASLFDEQARGRAELLFDLVETTGSAFLGLTMACCRCHDHKFDPISQADYYRMRAFFEGVAFADDLPLDLAAEQDAIRARNEEVDKTVAALQGERDALLDPIRQQLRDANAAALSSDERELLNAAPDSLDDETRAKRDELAQRIEPDDDAMLEAADEPVRAQASALAQQIDEAESRRRSFQTGLVMTDGDGEPESTFVLAQGDYRDPVGDPVAPGFLSILEPGAASIPPPAREGSSGRRRALARWIASPDNPLTARVIVNRIWQQHFGAGLVATPDDFGYAGARPSHPELLDWLASEFIESGWSLKHLHRLIVTSLTYRQTSSPGADAMQRGAAVDAENRLLWRANLRRLTAEQIRDSLLLVSGQLDADFAGGPPIWPDLPEDVLKANPAFLDDNAEMTKGWYPSPTEQRNVRSLYLIQKRTVRIPFMETFDLPDNSTSCARRTESIVAPQALTLLNGDLAANAARRLADLARQAAGAENPDALIPAVFRLALQRPPTETEHAACREFLENNRSPAELARAVLNTSEFFFVD